MGGFGPGGADFRAGRKLSAADLQLLILALLEEEPKHGYELIKLIDERSGGFYVPSPGVIYPALTYLEEIGYARCEAEGVKKLYSITDAGKAHLEENRATVDAMQTGLARMGEKMEHVRRAFSEEEDEDFGPRGRWEIREARHELRAALRRTRHSSPEEARRIAEILRHAAAEIIGEE